MKTKKEWAILGRFRKDDKFHCVINGSIGTMRFNSIEEVHKQLQKLKAEQEAEIASKTRRAQSVGGLGVSTPYYSEYDIVEWKIMEREVTPWYDVE